MADRMDDILQAAAGWADAQVDYAAMHASVFKTAQAKKHTLRRNVIRFASAAAAVLLLAGAGFGAMRRNSFNLMRGAAAPSTAYGAKPQDMPEMDAENSIYTLEGANDTGDAIGGMPQASAPATGAPATAGSMMDPAQPPSFCGSGCASLYWAEEELELPAVSFGTQNTVTADAAGFLYTVAGAAQADAEDYVARALDMYPGSFLTGDTQDATRQTGAYEASVELLDGAYVLTVSFANGNVIIQAKTARD